jgi:hypothetical protein
MNGESVKQFSTLAAVGVATGIVMENEGMSGIHAVFDHFYPGIMTVGLLAMAEPAKDAVLSQVPALRDFIAENGRPTKFNYDTWGRRAVKAIGATVELTGPLGDAPDEIAEILKRKPDAKIVVVEAKG